RALVGIDPGTRWEAEVGVMGSASPWGCPVRVLFAQRWSEVTAVDLVRRCAERHAETHHLRSADPLQVGAALVAAENDPAAREFVSLDRRQALAAAREGFRVLGP